MPPFSDEELIKSAKKGDKEAFKELFDKYSGKILSYLYRYIGDFQKAEDVTIATFLDVYQRLPAYEEKGKFVSWVYKIAVNFAKKEFRKKKRMKEVSLDRPLGKNAKMTVYDLKADTKLRPDQQMMSNELREEIEKIIVNLDKKYKNVLLLCDVQGLSYEEVAKILKCRKVTVGVRLSRARKLLCEALRRKGYVLDKYM